MPRPPEGPRKLLPRMQPGPKQAADLEIQHHLEERIDQLVSDGMSRDAARREAERSFGEIERVERELRTIASGAAFRAAVATALETFRQDLSYAARVLRRSRGFSALAVLTLALGIGTNTGLFTVVDSVLFRPLEIPKADRVVQIRERYSGSGPARFMSAPNFFDYLERGEAFRYLAPLSHTWFFQETSAGVDTVHVLMTTDQLLPLLAAEPVIGRGLTESDGAADAPLVAVISHAFWVERFGADADVVGRTLRMLDARRQAVPERTIVGVLPPEFTLPPVRDPIRWQARSAWGSEVPLELGASTAPDVLVPPPAAWRSEVNRGARRIHTVLGRLEDGWSVKQTEDVLSAVASGITATHLEVSGPESVEVTPLPRLIRDSYGRAFYLLWAGCGVVLLVACVNLASLLIARGLTREREMAVRASLGASRTRLFRQLTTEAFVLGAVGGLAAIPVAHGVTRGLVALFPGDVYRIATAAVDLRALGFLTMASAFAAVAFGVVPALRGGEVVGRGRLGEWLRHGSRSRLGVLRALVVGEVALTLTLVVSGGLILRSYLSLTNTDVGFEPEGLVHFWVGGRPGSGAFSKYEEGSQRAGVDILRRQLLERIEALPDVVSVAEGMPPLSGAASDWSHTLADRPPLAADARVVFDTRRAGPGYFATLGIPLREGRYLDEADEELSLRTWGSWGELRQRPELSQADVTLPAVVNETLARRYWPGESAIGKGVYSGSVEVGDESEGSNSSSIVWDRRNPPFTVVGVVGDVKTVGLDREPEPTFYSMGWGHSYLARVRGDPQLASEAIRREVESFDPALTVGGALPMEQRIADIAAEERFRMLVIVAAAALALMLAAVGLSAVVAYSVNQRRHEIGVRISLGAKRAEVLSLVGWQAVKLVSLGAAIGLALVAGLSRLLGSFLYGVAATDPLTFLGSLVLLGSVCVLASYLPARHAARVDPMEVLKTE